MTRYWMTACAAALLALGARCAAAQPPAHNSASSRSATALKQWYASTSANLSKRTDADSLVAAAVSQSDSERKLQLFDRAAKAAPHAADIAAQDQMTCTFIKGCDPVARSKRLHTIDPDNALAWMPELHAARAQSDATKATAVLRRMAQSKKFDTYSASIMARVKRALAALPLSPDPSLTKLSDAQARSLQAGGLALNSDAIPAYQSLLRACPPTNMQTRQRRTSCHQIGLLLEQSGTQLGSYIGATLHRRAAANATDYAQALATSRRLDWQREQFSSLTGAHIDTGMGAYTQAILVHHGDMRAIRAMLTKAGVALNPPAKWIDKAQAAHIAGDKKASRSASQGSAEHG